MILFALLVLLAACGGANQTPTATPESGPALEVAPDGDIMPRPTITPVAPGVVEDVQTEELREGYPPPSAPLPTVDPASYLGDPTATPDPYAAFAGEPVQILKAAGVQCETPVALPTAEDATVELTDAGIEVQAMEQVDLMVCTACNCPTSEHYVATIDGSNLGLAVSLGWVVAPEGALP
jgi:hypothetical protein